MTLDIGGVVRAGAERTLARNGIMFAAAFFLVNLASAFGGLRADAAPAAAGLAATPVVAGVVAAVLFLASLTISIAALRVFVTDETETVPDAAWKRNIGPALFHTIIGSLIFGVAVTLGLILLVIPGVYLMLSLFFWTVYVAVEDESFYEAMRSTWTMTKGHKWQLLGLVVAIVAVNLVLGAVGFAASVVGPGIGGMVVMQALSALGGVFALAAQARAYTELT